MWDSRHLHPCGSSLRVAGRPGLRRQAGAWMRVRVALAGGRVDVRAGCTGAWVLDAVVARRAMRGPHPQALPILPFPISVTNGAAGGDTACGHSKSARQSRQVSTGLLQASSLQGCGCGLQTLSRLPFAVSVICSVAIATSCRESEGIGARVPAGMPLAGG